MAAFAQLSFERHPRQAFLFCPRRYLTEQVTLPERCPWGGLSRSSPRPGRAPPIDSSGALPLGARRKNLAILAAIRRASSRVSSLAAANKTFREKRDGCVKVVMFPHGQNAENVIGHEQREKQSVHD